MLPLTTGVVLPQMVVTLALETPEARDAAEGALAADRRVLLVPALGTGFARSAPSPGSRTRASCPGGGRAMVLRGLARAARGHAGAAEHPGVWVEAEPVTETPAESGRRRSWRASTARSCAASPSGSARRASPTRSQGVDDPGALADTAGWWPDLSVERKVELLETLDAEARLEKALAWARDALAELEVADQIRQRVSDGMEKTQREFLLRQQLAAIRKELGESGDDEDVVDGLPRRKLAEARASRRRPAKRSRARSTGSSAPVSRAPSTGGSARGSTPCSSSRGATRSEDALDVVDARAVLDADHTGLDDVKDRIVEYLAVRKLRAERGMTDDRCRAAPGAILALVGPPGVGKTSLGESVARALGRKFVRVALGGVRDEAEIRGHRRTYVGARPGRIVRALNEAGTMNPVILLDEVDKLGADWRGDPSSALLEVLDPAQNHTFRDHYLEVDLDLSDVLFLATANVLDTIPGPLLDRMEVVRLDGYTEEEKVAIARDHLLARQLERNGLPPTT